MTKETSFEARPHRTVLTLSVPVFFSLIAEPLTGMVDTYFVGRLGTASLAALGVGTIVLSSVFWVFNFLGISTQTEVARAAGAGDRGSAQKAFRTALGLAFGFGVALFALTVPWLDEMAAFMGTEGPTRDSTLDYLWIRLLGGPFVLVTIVSFGAMRGLQDMKSPLWIAIAVNAMNVVLDPILILGWGPIPSFGMEGAATATVVAQIAGAIACLYRVRRELRGKESANDVRALKRLLAVGGDMFIRTGCLMMFMILATREATRVGDEAGAAHQVIRQVWMLSALVLDAFAATAQSLIGYYVGARRNAVAIKVAAVTNQWGVLVGFVLTLGMLSATSWIERALVPESSREMFRTAWWICAAMQPINALSFVTDGVHWGTRDYRFLRDVMILSTGAWGAALLFLAPKFEDPLAAIWVLTVLWVTTRALFGVLRVWPGIGRSPLRG